MTHFEMDRLVALVEDSAREELLTRFRALDPNDVLMKRGADGSHEIVTAADRAMEIRLSSKLVELVPGSMVVGEESAAAAPALLAEVGRASPVWVVDPLDGTANFAAGDDRFGVMIALVVGHEIVCSSIYFPISGEHYVAEAGAGVRRNGEPLLRQKRIRPLPAGAMHTNFAPPDVRSRIDALSENAVDRRPSPGCAAVAYTEVANGNWDFVQFYRLLPWDHVPGALVVREAGGVVAYVDGSPYYPHDRRGLLLAAGDPDTWRDVAALLR